MWGMASDVRDVLSVLEIINLVSIYAELKIDNRFGIGYFFRCSIFTKFINKSIKLALCVKNKKQSTVEVMQGDDVF